MARLGDDLAQWLFEHVNLPWIPPVNLEELAISMGVTSITEISMVEDGRLEQKEQSAKIYVRSGLPESRRRFTIAHELGHRLLLHPRASAERHRRRITGDSEERLCDDIAAAILLPRNWVASNYGKYPRELKTVRSLALSTGTSMSASLVRLTEVARWQESLLRFRCVEGRWRLDAPAAVPHEIHGQIRTTSATSETLSRVGNSTREDVWTRLPIKVSGADREAPSQLSVIRSVAVALANLRSQPSQ